MLGFNRRPFSTLGSKLILASAAVFGGLAVTCALGLFHRMNHRLALAIMLGTLALGFGLTFYALRLTRKEAPLFKAGYMRRHADLVSGVRWRMLLGHVVVLFALAPFVNWSMDNVILSPQSKALYALPIIIFFSRMIAIVKVVAGGKDTVDVDDELTASFRAGAWRVGFVVLLTAVSAAYLLTRLEIWPSVGAATPYVLALGVGATAARFAWLERASAQGA